MSNKYVVRVLVPVDRPTKNNRVYSREVINKVIEETREKVEAGEFLVYAGGALPEAPDLRNVVGRVQRLFVEDELFEAEMEVFQHTEILDGLGATPIGVGTLKDKDGIVFVADDYKMTGVNLRPVGELGEYLPRPYYEDGLAVAYVFTDGLGEHLSEVPANRIKVKTLHCARDACGLNVVTIEDKPDHPLYRDVYARWLSRHRRIEIDNWPKRTKPGEPS